MHFFLKKKNININIFFLEKILIIKKWEIFKLKEQSIRFKLITLL